MAKARVSDVLEWGAIIGGPTPTVILNKGYTFMATLAYTGADVSMLSVEERVAYLHRLTALIGRLGTGWCLLADAWHEPTTTSPESDWDNDTSAFVDQCRKSLFAAGKLYITETYLTLCWQPPRTAAAHWYERFFHTTSTADRPAMDRDQEAFVHAVGQWSDGLTGLLPAWHWLSPTATLTYLHRCVSWDRAQVRLPELPTNLAARLATDDFVPGHTPRLGTHYVRPLEIQSWPHGDPDRGGGLGWDVPVALQALAIPHRFTVRYAPLDTHDAQALLRSMQRKWDAFIVQTVRPSHARQMAEETAQALQDLFSHEVQYGYATPIVTVWGTDMPTLTHRAQVATRALQGEGLLVAQSPINACQAWLGTMPGDMVHNVRAPLLPSLALAYLLPHATVWAGHPRDTHLNGPPLFTTSSDGTPFHFVLHAGNSELGNTMVLGPSRSGKSAIIGLMASQFQRYTPGPQVVIFDKDYSLYGVTVLHGGTHYDLGGATPLGLQPLALPGDTVEEQRWATDWILAVVASQGTALSPEDREECWAAMGRMVRMPQDARTLSAYAAVVQVRAVKQALAPFLAAGPYAFLDADHDDLTWHPWTTIEMRRLQAMPQALPHVLRYLFHRLDARFTGRPTLIILDESRKLLSDVTFGPEILDFLKERAKKNVSVVLSTQEIADAASTPVWQAIQGSCQTWLFLPNPAATSPSVSAFYADCGVTPAQQQLLARSTPLQDYLYRSPTGVRRFQVRLSPLERLLVAASTVEEIAALRDLAQGRKATDPSLVSQWLALHGLHEEAHLYEKGYQ